MNTIVTSEEFKQFHTIDRDMYRKLIFSLRHDPLLSIRIMAFWLWLECSGKRRNLIVFLHYMSSQLLNSLVLETITCIYCIDEPSVFSLSLHSVGLPYFQLILTNVNFSIPYLINNKVEILETMQKISESVCARAFDDLLAQQLLSQRQQYPQTRGSVFHSGASPSSSNNVPTIVDIVQDHILRSDIGVGVGVDITKPVVVGPRRNNIVGRGETSEIRSEEKTTDVQNQSALEQANLGSRMSTQHERTVFLTFSKGYPVTESQLREYFIRRFGEIIEDLIMQDVPQDEQPLYARMLVHSSNQVELVLGGQNRVKFTINGKHVYGRKYVKKNPKASTNSSFYQHSTPSSSSVATTSEYY
ncbi:uncharacterized protein LOC124916226 [Impatiens glandulifera]|uniref:uncharacterized protein LOC124916226 n=1 Tax=Impatiens glandulifera TaxID=253017 RepID=UPI001FB0EF4B|nr:uncharacterized protein LOC124916226 [Impatiens glandulifera]